MSKADPSPAVIRSLSMPGLLAFICGLLVLLSLSKFVVQTADWPSTLRTALRLGGGVLLLWGGFTVYRGLFPRPGENSISRMDRNRVMLPTEGLVYLLIMAVLLVGSLLGHSNMLMLVFALMAGPFILNGWITFGMLRRTSVERLLPRRMMAGEPISVEMRFANHKRFVSAWLMAVTDYVANRRERLEARVLFVRVPPREERRASYQLRLMQRGVYEFGPIQITTRFPMGLVERGLLFDDSDRILVYPRIGRLTPRWRRQLLTASELVHRREPRTGVFDDEFHRIREFRSGDNPRAIHWRTAARRNELMVREFHQSRDNDLCVLLELWAPARPEIADLERVELAVSFVATICVEFLQNSRDSEIALSICGGHDTEIRSRSGSAVIEPILDELAVAEPHPFPKMNEMLQKWQTVRTSHMRTVLVTTRPQTTDVFSLGDRIAADGGGVTSPEVLLSSGIEILPSTPEALEPYFQVE